MRNYLYLLLLTSNLAWAELPLSFTSVPDVGSATAGQPKSLSYTIRNNLKKQALPIQQISVINNGDAQTQLTATINSTCGSSLAPQASCSLEVGLNGIQSGKISRSLNVQYGGRAPLTSPIVADVKQAKYTVLIYIVGSNLESEDNSASINISQMMKVGSDENLNIVIETGGAKKDGWRTVKRHLILPDQDLELDDLGAVNMGLVSTITSFFTWGMTQFPADKYIAIFWNHGGGPNSGYGSDDIFGESQTAINELSIALSDITQQTGKLFEIIGFDTCLLGNIETFAGLYRYSNYLVGSEDSEPGLGWQYNTFLKLIADHPTVDGLQIGTNIVNGFTEQNVGSSTTLSVIKAADIPNVVSAVDQFATSLLPYANSSLANWRTLAKARIKTPDYGTSSWDSESYDVADIVGLANSAIYYFPSDPLIQDSANALINATQTAVKYRKNSPNRGASYGLTIYFPSIMRVYQPQYQTVTLINGETFFSQPYLNFVSNYNQFYFAQSSNLIANPTGLAFNGTDYTANVSNDYEEIYAAVGNNTCNNVFLPNGTSVGVVPCYSSIQQTGINATPGGGNTWNISYEKAANAANWPLINGQPMLFISLDTEPVMSNEISFIIPVMKMDGRSGYLDVVRDSNNIYKVVGFQLDTGSNNPEGKTVDIADGTPFYLRTYAQLSGTWRLLRTNNVITSPFTITSGNVPGGLNAFRFIVSDLTGTLQVTTNSVAY